MPWHIGLNRIKHFDTHLNKIVQQRCHSTVGVHDQNNIRMWVASSSARLIIDSVLQKLDIQNYFSGIVSGDDD